MPRAKRHKKMKAIDPFCTGNRKKLLLAQEQKFNNAPKNTNDQEMSRSFKDMLEAKQIAEQSLKQKIVQKVGSFERKPEESHNHFMKRVGKNAQRKLTKERCKRERDNTEPSKLKKEMTQKKKERLAILQQRRKGKQFEKTLESREKDFYKDHVKFGEVVSAPPIFTAKPRKSSDQVNKPGRRDLLLKSVLDQTNTSQDHGDKIQKPNRLEKMKQENGKIKKRKHMTIAEKRNFDRSRQAAIVAYRNTKGHSQDGTMSIRANTMESS